MRLSNLFYRSPRLLVLFLALIAVSGLAALQLLPRAEDPELTSRNAQIYVAFPGADADRVEALVTERIEDLLGEFEEIKEIKSYARPGLSTTAIELLDAIVDVDPIWTDMRDDLADLAPDLPAGTATPELVEFELAAYTLMVGLRWDLDAPPERAILGRAADELADALRDVSGTHDVVLRGQPAEEILVELDPGALAARGLDPERVSRAVVAGDAKVAAGEWTSGTRELQLQVSGEIESLERLRSLVVDRGTGAEAGRLVRLGDVATITKGERDPRIDRALIDGDAGVVVAARMEVGRRVDLWAADALRVTNETLAALPSGISGEVLFDQSRYTEERLSALATNFGTGVGLVILVLLFTMGWRSAVIVGTAVPLTTLMVLHGLRTLDVPLHQMSITGRIIALGLLIDNAIVVVDEVRKRLSEGDDAGEAVAGSVRHLAVPLFGSTLTTCLAFAPIALMPGGAGEFVGPISISVILAVASSFFLALTVTPALAGLLDRAFPPKKRSGFLANGLSSKLLDRLYGRVLGFLYGLPLLGVAVAAVLPMAGFMAAGRMSEQFFPPADRDQFNVQFYLEPSRSLEATEEFARAARAKILENDAVDRVHIFLGESGPKYYYNLVENQRDAPYYAQAFVQLKSAEGSIAVVREVQDALDAAFPEAVVLAQQIEQGPPFDAPVEMHVYGPDLARLREISDSVRRTLTEIPQVTHVRTSLEPVLPTLRVALDDASARLLGADNRSIARSLDLGLSGAVGGSLVEANEELPVRVRFGDGTREDVDRLETLALPTPGGWTPLASIGTLELVPETAAVAHRNRRRVASVQGFLRAGVLPSEVLEELRTRLDASGLELPEGFELEVGGESAKRDEAVGNLAGSAAVLLVLMAASLVLTFNSFRLAAVTLAVAGLSAGLSIFALAVFQYPFGINAIIGVIGSI
ncbi:MAG: efflux RND transporter permease subunit, partial [Planctomycetota bacterium]